MLALHTFAMDSADNPLPRYVAPGDSCTRTDDPGWRWHCIAGHGTTLADWERRPLAGALAAIESGVSGAQPLDADLTAIAAQGVSAWGLARLGDYGATTAKVALGIEQADVAGLVAALAAKQDSLTNATALARISALTDGPLLWDGDELSSGASEGTTIVCTPGPITGAEVAYTYSSNGDTNGIFYAIGVYAGNGTWKNPHTAGAIIVTLIGQWQAGTSPAWEVDRATTNSYQAQWQLGNCIKVDLGEGRSCRPNRYTMRNYSGSDRYARNWTFAGSNDAVTWTPLDVRVGDKTMSGGSYAWGSYAVTQPATAYRYFRWITTGNDSNGDPNFATNEIEIYGAATLTPVPVPSGMTGWATDGAGHYWPYL